MSNTTLFLRSLAVIILLSGFAHIFAYTSQGSQPEVVVETSLPTDTSNSLLDTIAEPSASTEVAKTDTPPKQLPKPTNYNAETDYITGKWKVTYDSEAFKGAIIYNLKKEGKTFNAYTFQYEDENGYSQKAEGFNILTIKKFDGYQGTGIYKLEYEGEKYDVACQIDMVDENTFKLSYDYYGYSDVETWKRF